MRSKEVISELSPCDNDLTDPTLQTIQDAKRRGPVYCSNVGPCQSRSHREGISCVRSIAKQMVGFVVERMENGETRKQALSSEVQDYLDNGPDGKFWTFRGGKWKIAKNKRQVMGDISSFADTILGK